MIRAIADGRCLVEGNPGYDQARTVWNAMVDRRPRALVRCASAVDVADAIRYGRERDLEIGVRCGGHSVLGLCVPDGGLMIDLSPMGGVRVDPVAVAPGCRAGRCSAPWIALRWRKAWPRPPATCLIPAWAG